MSSNRVTPARKAQIYSQYGVINEDVGYRVWKENHMVHMLLPYKPDIETRLVNYLRALYFYHKYGITHCLPFEQMYYIRRPDWNKIHRYLKKYRIRVFDRILKF